VVFSLAAILIVIADQLSKKWINGFLPVGQSLPITSFLRLTHVNNSGGAFGLFQGQAFLLTIVACVGIVILLVYVLFMYRRFPFLSSKVGKLALGLILGGTIGNLIDRVRMGYVTDFIDFGVGMVRWPSFNIADSAVVIGVILFAYSLIFVAEAVKSGH